MALDSCRAVHGLFLFALDRHGRVSLFPLRHAFHLALSQCRGALRVVTRGDRVAPSRRPWTRFAIQEMAPEPLEPVTAAFIFRAVLLTRDGRPRGRPSRYATPGGAIEELLTKLQSGPWSTNRFRL